jgi:hypothetical protein
MDKEYGFASIPEIDFLEGDPWFSQYMEVQEVPTQ